MNDLSESESSTSKAVASAPRKSGCNRLPKKPTEPELNWIKNALQNHTRFLLKEAHDAKYGWEDAFNPFEIEKCMKNLERRVDKLDFQVEVNIDVNKKFLSKIADAIENGYLFETY